MKPQHTVIIIGIALIVIVFSVFMVSSSPVDNSENEDSTDDKEPVIENITSKQVRNTNEMSKVLSYNSDNLTIKGQITGDKAGQYVIVESLEKEGSTVNLTLETLNENNSGIGATVLTGYEYEIKLGGVSKNDTVNVKHKSVNNNTYKLSTNQTKDDKNIPNVNIEESKNSNITEDSDIEFNRNIHGEIEIHSQITANTGGHYPKINSVELENGTLKIVPTLVEPDGLAPQVISEYKYKVTIENNSNFDSISIKNNGDYVNKTVSEIDENKNVPEDDITYKFERYQDTEYKYGNVTNVTESGFIIEGHFLTGSSSCTYIDIKDFDVNSNKTATIDLLAVKNEDKQECTDDINRSGYKINVTDNGYIENIHLNIDSYYEDTENVDLDVR